MPRGPRSDAPGTIHHVTFRGIERGEIFLDDLDREALLVRVDRLSVRTRTLIFAWVLMPNHVHLVIQTELGVLSRYMARLNTSYALYFNRRHGRAGYVFQNRFWSRPLEADLEKVVDYVHFSPVRAGIVPAAELSEYPWCGHATRLGKRAPRLFECSAFTDAGAPRDLPSIVKEECARADVPSVAVGYGRTPAANALRARIVRRALRETTLTGAQIGRLLGIARSTVSQIASRES